MCGDCVSRPGALVAQHDGPNNGRYTALNRTTAPVRMLISTQVESSWLAQIQLVGLRVLQYGGDLFERWWIIRYRYSLMPVIRFDWNGFSETVSPLPIGSALRLGNLMRFRGSNFRWIVLDKNFLGEEDLFRWIHLDESSSMILLRWIFLSMNPSLYILPMNLDEWLLEWWRLLIKMVRSENIKRWNWEINKWRVKSEFTNCETPNGEWFGKLKREIPVACERFPNVFLIF